MFAAADGGGKTLTKKSAGCTQEWTGVNMERVIGCTLTKNTDCTQKTGKV